MRPEIERSSCGQTAPGQLLALFHGGAGYRALPGWEELHPYNWRARALAGQLYDLCQQGLLTRTDHKPVNGHRDANPSHLWVGGMAAPSTT